MSRHRRTNIGQGVGSDLLNRLARLRIDKSNGGRQPHKPLLMLLAIQHWVVRGERELPYPVVAEELLQLLKLYAPPKTGRHSPDMPYWHLQSDGVWELPGVDRMARTSKGKPTMAAFNASVGRIKEPYATALASDPALAARAVQVLLDQNFAPSLHDDLRAEIGLEDLTNLPTDVTPDHVAEPSPKSLGSGFGRARLPSFRSEVLAAYDYRCAVTGYQALISGAHFCLEAAHVQWHSYGGPSSVDNGLALTPTLHKLFDHGAWTLDDERRVLVSRNFSGSDGATSELRGLHGKPLRQPAPGFHQVSLEHIRWHREPGRGGVFKWPALPSKSV